MDAANVPKMIGLFSKTDYCIVTLVSWSHKNTKCTKIANFQSITTITKQKLKRYDFLKKYNFTWNLITHYC